MRPVGHRADAPRVHPIRGDAGHEALVDDADEGRGAQRVPLGGRGDGCRTAPAPDAALRGGGAHQILHDGYVRDPVAAGQPGTDDAPGETGDLGDHRVGRERGGRRQQTVPQHRGLERGSAQGGLTGRHIVSSPVHGDPGPLLGDPPHPRYSASVRQDG